MIRRSGLLLLEITLALAAALMIGVGVLSWRLASGPIPLPSFESYVESELAAARDGRPVRLEDVELAWSPQRRGLEVRARNVLALDKSGQVLSRSDEVALGVSLPRLLIGRLALERATFRGGEASLVLAKDGSAAIAFGPPGSTPDIVLPAPPENETMTARVNRMLDGLAATFRPLGAGGALRGLRVERLHVAVIDEKTGAQWTAKNASFELTREKQLVRARADVPLEGARGATPLELAITADATFQSAAVELKIKGAPMPALAPSLPALAAVNAPVTAAVSASLDRTRGVDRFDGDVSIGRGAMEFPGGKAPIDGGRFRGRYDVADDALVIEEAALAGSRTRVKGVGRIERASTLMRAGADTDAAFDINFTSVDLDMPGVLAAPIALTDVRARGVASRTLSEIAVTEAHFGVDGATVHGAGKIYWRAGKDGRWRPGVRAEGGIDGVIGPRSVLKLWPVQLADGARAYLDDALRGGALTGVTVKADVTPEMIEKGEVPNAALDLNFRFAEADVEYVEGMTPITVGRGVARLQGNAFSLQLESGRIGTLAVSRGRIELPRLNPKGALATFAGRVDGETRAVVDLLRQAPIELDEVLPVDPATIVGTGGADFAIRRPMLSNVPAKDYRFTVDARFDGVGGVLKQAGVALSDWKMRVSGDERALTFAGPLAVGASRADVTWTQGLTGGPTSSRYAIAGQFQTADLERLGYPVELFARGPVAVSVRGVGAGADVQSATVSADLTGALAYLPVNFWRKAPGQAATVRFDVARVSDEVLALNAVQARADGLELAGSAKLRRADGAVTEARVERALIDGRAAGTATLRMRPDGVAAISADGALFNVSPFITPAPADDPKVAALPAPAPRREKPFPMDVQMRVQKLTFNADAAVTGGRLSMSTDGVALTRLAIDGADPGGKPVTLSITPRPGATTGRISFRAEDAGFAWKAVTGQANVRGGSAQADGVWTPGAPGSAKLTLLMTDFQLVDMPVMARLLSSVGSLQGLAAMMNGDGIAFSSLEAPLTLDNGRITLGECRMAGPSLGLTAKGRIDLETGALAIDGVVVPSYGLNSMLSGVPVLGSLLTSRRGEGVVGITYSVKGPAEAARVGVNPLSALTPGILRRIFEPIPRAAPAAPPTPAKEG